MILPPPPNVRIIENAGRRALWDHFPSRSDDCPGHMWVYDRAYGKAEVNGWICGSVQHLYEPCATRYVGEHLENLNKMFHRHQSVDGELVPREAIYFVSADYNAILLNRLNQRRHSREGGYVVIRRGWGRIDGQPATVDIYSEKPYQGTRFPSKRDWVSLKPGDAIQQVADRSLVLPGIFSAKGVTPVTYSGTWEPPFKKLKGDGDLPDRYLTLGLARKESTFAAAERVMAVIVALYLGITSLQTGTAPSYEMIPERHRKWWLDTTWSVIGRLNAGQSEGEIVSWWLRANAGET